jgi:cyclopropane fatty-acyl-phospholipid synthase-like methyltransferase
MTQGTDHAICFYSRHPISLGIVLARLHKTHGDLAGLKPRDLWAHDQDHYGGLAANDSIAERASIVAGSRVADFCAGLGGPARYYAAVYGADVTGIEVTPDRVAGAAELTRLVGLQDRVRVVQGDVTDVPLTDESIDAVVSQEALLHVSDKARALREAFRILRHGGRLAFTDLICHSQLTDADAALMWDGMAIQTLQDLADYRTLQETVGFGVLSIEDLTDEWGPILQNRLAMYQEMRREAEIAGTPAGPEAFHRSYVRFVELIMEKKLGGIRATAEKP